jgi:Zn-dependent M28 family amino/carboxypeptidase
MRVAPGPHWKRLAPLLLAVGTLTICGGCMIRMPLKSFSGPLPDLTRQQTNLSDELRRHVEKLAGEIGERNVQRPQQLRAAVDYIENAFTNIGYKVTRQSYQAGGQTCFNLEAEKTGKARRNEIVVVGAHYDSVTGSPGANDNASGIAAVLSLARAWSERDSDRTIRFVAFVNEEPPFFQTEQMGSLVYARHCRHRGDQIVAMFSPETMGCYSTAKGSQKYPFPVGICYPSQGDFIAFVGNTANRGLIRRCVKTFRERASFPSEGAALPGMLRGIGWSDHWAFWQAGYPGLMVTDTAPFRYPYYHTPEDTPDKLDYGRLARVVDGLGNVLEELVEK